MIEFVIIDGDVLFGVVCMGIMVIRMPKIEVLFKIGFEWFDSTLIHPNESFFYNWLTTWSDYFSFIIFVRINSLFMFLYRIYGDTF